MASSYGGISFRMIAENEDNTIKRPMMVVEDWGIVRNRIPFMDMEQIQFTGRGNQRVKIKCEIYDDADFQTLYGMACDNTARTLTTEWGDSWTNILLMDITDVWRVSFAEEVHFTATFEQAPGT